MFEWLAKKIAGAVRDVQTVVEDTFTEISNIPDALSQGYKEGLILKPNEDTPTSSTSSPSSTSSTTTTNA